MKRYHVYVILGMLVSAGWFTICDRFFHVNNSILVYHWRPIYQGQSVWAFPIFFLASLGFYFFTRPISIPWNSDPSWSRTALNIVICTMAYFASGLFGISHPMVLFFLVLLVWVVRIILTHEHRITAIKACLIMGLFGCFLEGASSKLVAPEKFTTI